MEQERSAVITIAKAQPASQARNVNVGSCVCFLCVSAPKPRGSEARIPRRNTWMWVEERDRCLRELASSVPLSLSHPLECVTFSPACVIQRGNSLCSPGEHKQLTALLIHAGALNSSQLSLRLAS